MTALDREPTTTDAKGSAGAGGSQAGASGPPSGRRRALASVILGVAILATGGVAVGYLVQAPASTTQAPPPSASPAPASPPPAPQNAPAAQPAPQPAPAQPAAQGTAVVTDTAGTPLPPPVAAAVNQASANLAAGNVAALQASYVPSRTVRAAPWPTVAGLLADPANRAALLAALRTAPTRTVDGWRYTSPTGDQVGIDPQGAIGYVRLS